MVCPYFGIIPPYGSISLETSACRMVLNQDGSIQLQLGETEIGQGADTAFAQMAAETLGIKFEDVHVMTVQGHGRNALRYGSLRLQTDICRGIFHQADRTSAQGQNT